MDVFVIPIASDRYELYCEPAGESEAADVPDAEDGGQGPGLLRRVQEWLRRTKATRWAMALLDRWSGRVIDAVKAAERGDVPDASSSWLGRLQVRMTAWIAERIAEQRLLWRLRRQTAAVAVHPDDLTFDQVMTLITRTLQRDYDRHRLWLIIDAVGMVLSWPLFLIPGPNLLLYYFMVRVGGHWLSMGGARQGMRSVAWTGRPCASLADLRGAAALEPAARDRRVGEVAAQLRLVLLPRFFARVAVPHA